MNISRNKRDVSIIPNETTSKNFLTYRGVFPIPVRHAARQLSATKLLVHRRVNIEILYLITDHLAIYTIQTKIDGIFHAVFIKNNCWLPSGRN